MNIFVVSTMLFRPDLFSFFAKFTDVFNIF